MTQRKSWLQNYAEYTLALFLIGALRFLPLRAANSLAEGICRLLDRLVPKLRRVALINLAFAFPELGVSQQTQIVDGVFRSMARLLIALAKFPMLNRSNIGAWIGYDGLENYIAAKQEGKGVLVATAHLGNWELSAFAHALMTEPMNVMVRPLDNPFIDRLIEKRRVLSGNRLIFKRDAARAVIRALKDEEAVGVLVDQNTAANEGLFIRFFGKLACTNTGFVKLAYHTGAPIVPGFALWDEARKRYVLRFYPKIELTGDLPADTQRIHSLIEEIIRQYPDQWLWIHRRWKTRPEGEPPFY